MSFVLCPQAFTLPPAARLDDSSQIPHGAYHSRQHYAGLDVIPFDKRGLRPVEHQISADALGIAVASSSRVAVTMLASCWVMVSTIDWATCSSRAPVGCSSAVILELLVVMVFWASTAR